MDNEASTVRWYVKKTARTGFAVGGAARAWIGRGAAGVRVLTYHHIGDARRDPFSVAADDFDAQMAWLAQRRLAVSLADVEAYRAGTRTLPPGAVLVTVDDGLRSLLSRGLPVLRRHGIPAVAFVSAGEVGSTNGGAADPSRTHLSWSELSALADAGVTVGSHAWRHRSLGRLAPAEVRDELAQSRDALEQRVGRRVTALAYPFGTRADFNDTTARLCGETGYTCAFTSQHGAVRPGADPFTLPRVKVEGGEPRWMFGLLCGGAMDGWGWVDRTMWRLQEGGR